MPLAEEKLMKLDRVLSLLDADNALTKKDFESAFSRVVDLVQKILESHQSAIQNLEGKHNKLIKELQDGHTNSLSELKGKVNDLFVKDRLDGIESSIGANFTSLQKKIDQMVENKMKDVDFRMSRVKDSPPGPIGPPGPEGKVPQNLIDRFSGIEDKIKSLHESVKKAGAIRMGRAKVPMLRMIDLTSSVDGSATTFTLPMDTVQVHGVWTTGFTKVLRPDVDYTLSGRTLTIVERQVGIIPAGQTLVALVETLFYP